MIPRRGPTAQSQAEELPSHASVASTLHEEIFDVHFVLGFWLEVERGLRKMMSTCDLLTLATGRRKAGEKHSRVGETGQQSRNFIASYVGENNPLLGLHFVPRRVWSRPKSSVMRLAA